MSRPRRNGNPIPHSSPDEPSGSAVIPGAAPAPEEEEARHAPAVPDRPEEEAPADEVVAAGTPAAVPEEATPEEPSAGEPSAVEAHEEEPAADGPAASAPQAEEEPTKAAAAPGDLEEEGSLGESPDAADSAVEMEDEADVEEPPVSKAPAATTEEEAGPKAPPAGEELLAAPEEGVAEEPSVQAPAVAVEAEATVAAVADTGKEEAPASVEAIPTGEEETGAPAAVLVSAPEGGGIAVAEAEPTDPEAAALALEARKRRRLILALAGLVVLLFAAGAILVYYLLRPGPLPDLLPLPVGVNYRPHYLFSMYGVELPVGVAVSPDGERIYVTESGGEREVKILDRDGTLLGTLVPPQTQPAERAPVYVAVDPVGRVLVTDRLQRAVFVYDSAGRLLDAIVGPHLTLSEYLSQHADGLQADGLQAFNGFEGTVLYQQAGQRQQALPAPDPAGWAPLGVRVDEQGTMLVTNVAAGQHVVCRFPSDTILAESWQEFDPPEFVFGAQGQGSEELLFPNAAVADSQGRIYVTDGNNGRISVWDEQGAFLFTFGRGVGEGALSLPRGAVMDGKDRLHVVDAVQQAVKVYDVSGPEPRFLYTFGEWGTEDGQFSYPGDIALDRTGRLYIADRENDRIQVWSY